MTRLTDCISASKVSEADSKEMQESVDATGEDVVKGVEAYLDGIRTELEDFRAQLGEQGVDLSPVTLAPQTQPSQMFFQSEASVPPLPSPLANPDPRLSNGTQHGLSPHLRVFSDVDVATARKDAVMQATTNGNARSQLEKLDRVLDAHPDAHTSEEAWSAMLADAFAMQDVPMPPRRFINDINGDGSRKNLARLTKGQIADAGHGFENAADFRKAYTDGSLGVSTTGKLFLWSFLSRGVSPYTQESLFIDAFPGIEPWMEQAAAGTFDKAAYSDWVETVAAAGSGQPGAGSTHNLNAFGKDFLVKMSMDVGDGTGRSRLQYLHDMMSDPEATGKQIRREFATFGQGVGIDNKVVSFTLLVAGFSDVMVLDRVQFRQLYDDGRFAGINLYDGFKKDGKVVNGSGFAKQGDGVRGLIIYEAIERALESRIGEIYSSLGREGEGSVGRYHWESWVTDSHQEASHGTLAAILPDALGDRSAIHEVTAKQGEYGSYAYGARYGVDGFGTPYFTYQTASGKIYIFNVEQFVEFQTEIKKPKNKVVPANFKVTEGGNAPWYIREEVNSEALDRVAERTAEGRAGSGAGTVREDGSDRALPYRSTALVGHPTDFAADQVTTFNQSAPSAATFYSALTRAVAEFPQAKASPQQWLGMMRKNEGVKPAEVEWSGVEEWLSAQTGAVTRTDLVAFLEANEVQVEEVVKGEKGGAERYGELDARIAAGETLSADEMAELASLDTLDSETSSTTKFATYTLPGGENYRELLLTLPTQGQRKATKTEIDRGYASDQYGNFTPITDNNMVPRMEDEFRGDHFDEPNVLAHVRFNERTVDVPHTPEQAAAAKQWAEAGSRLSEINKELKSLAEKTPQEKYERAQQLQDAIANNHAIAFTEQESLDLMHGAGNVVGLPVKRAGRLRQLTEERSQILSALPEKPPQQTQRVLFIEEIQSDWHQKGRKEGYKGDIGKAKLVAHVNNSADKPYFEVRTEDGTFVVNITSADTAEEAVTMAGEYLRISSNAPGVPDAPFKTTWQELAFKRALRWATENGFDSIAWTTGEQQVERYGSALRNQVDEIHWEKTKDGVHLKGYKGVNGRAEYMPTNHKWRAHGHGGQTEVFKTEAEAMEWLRGTAVVDTTEAESALSDAIGKSMGEKILSDPAQSGVIKGDDITIDSTGMAGFYDKMLPRFAAKYTKKWGGKVGTVNLGLKGDKIASDNLTAEDRSRLAELDEHRYDSIGWTEGHQAERVAIFEAAEQRAPGTLVHNLPITDAMRESVNEGQPLFQENRGSISFFPDRAEINFTKAKDLSTFLHEAGHLFVHTLAKIAETDANAAADLSAMFNFVGVESVEAFNETIPQEKLARAFEAYLREGKAPSVELQGAFSRFQDWLITVYKSLRQLDIELTDEIRGVFDRMVATDEQIAEAEAANNYVLHDSIADLMTEEEKANYSRAGDNAHARGVEDLKKKKAAEAVREETVAWKAELAAIVEEKTKALNEAGVYQAIADIKGGMFLSIEAVTELYGAEGAAELPTNMKRKTGGVHPDTVARLHGYDSGGAMLMDIFNAETSKKGQAQLVAERALAEMEEVYGSLDTNKRQAAEEAGNAVLNDERGLFLAMELKALSLKSGTQPTPASVAKAAAKRILSDKKVKDATTSERYVQAASKAGRDTLRFLLAEDYTAATEAKMRQLMNHYLAREARDVAEQIDPMIDRMRKWKNSTINPKSHHPDFIKQGKALLANVSFVGRIGQKAIDSKIKQTFDAWGEEMTKEYGARFHLDAELEAALSKNHYGEMTVSELRGLYDTVKSVLAQGRRYSQSEQAQFQTMVGHIKDSVDEHAGPDTHKQKIERDFWSKTKKVGRGAMAHHRRIDSLSDELDGYKGFGGQVHRNVYLRIKHADDNYMDRSNKSAEVVNDILGKYTAVEKAAFYRKKLIPELGESLSLDARLAFALNMGNAGNVTAMEKEYSPEQIRAVLKTLSDKDWDVVEELWAYIDTFWGELSALEERTTGVMPAKVEAVPFDTPSGRRVTGGYYPLVGDPERGEGKTDMEKRVSMEDFTGGGRSKVSTKSGSTIERKGWGNDRRVWMDLSVAFGHIDGVIKDIELREAVVEVQRIVSSRDFKSAVTAAKGPEFQEMYLEWLENVVGINKPHLTGTEKFWQHARTGASIAEMGFSLRTMALQPFGITQSVAILGESAVAVGMAQWVSHPLTATQKVMALSSFMANRGRTFNRDVRDSHRLMGPKVVQENITTAAFFGIQMMDMSVSIPTWLGGYWKATEKLGLTGQDAVDYADGAVSRSQGTGLPRDMAEIQQRGPLHKLFTMYYTFFGSYHNLQADLYKQTSFKDPVSAVKWAKNQLYITLIPSLGVDWLMNAAVPDSDDDWRKWIGWGSQSVIKFATGGIVIGRDIVGSVMSGFGYQVTPAAGLIINATELAKQLGQGEIDEAVIKHAILLAGYGAKLPARAGVRAMQVYNDEGFDDLDEFELWWKIFVQGKDRELK